MQDFGRNREDPNQGFAPEGKCTRVGRYWVAPFQDFAPGVKRVNTHTRAQLARVLGVGCRVFFKKAGTTNVLIPMYDVAQSAFCEHAFYVNVLF